MEELDNQKNPSTEESVEAKKAKKPSFGTRINNYLMPKDIQLDMLRYRPNKLAYTLGLLAAVLLAVGFCAFYSGTELNKVDNFNLLGITKPGPILGIDIVLNIVMMLFMLFAAMEMKNYSLTLGYVSMGIGIFQIIRIFLLPFALTRIGCMNIGIFITITVFYILSGICSIIAGILSIDRGKALRKYLKTVKPIENEKVGK